MPSPSEKPTLPRPPLSPPREVPEIVSKLTFLSKRYCEEGGSGRVPRDVRRLSADIDGRGRT